MKMNQNLSRKDIEDVLYSIQHDYIINNNEAC